MIKLYSGVPGSGKTLHAVEDGIYGQARYGGVIANFPITRARKDKRTGNTKWLYVPEDQMTPEFFAEQAARWEDRDEEGVCLVIIDEAHRILNSRSFFGKDQGDTRMKLLRFLSEHRHWGYDVILVAQSDIMLDKQARPLIELEVRHLRLDKQYWFIPIPIFLRITYWYGMRAFRGHFGMALFSWARGRYDHHFMRRAERERVRGRATLVSGPRLGLSGGGVAGGDDGEAVRVGQGVDEVLERPALAPEVLVGDAYGAPVVEVAGEVGVAVFESADHGVDLVVAEGQGDEHVRPPILAVIAERQREGGRSNV